MFSATTKVFVFGSESGASKHAHVCIRDERVVVENGAAGVQSTGAVLNYCLLLCNKKKIHRQTHI